MVNTVASTLAKYILFGMPEVYVREVTEMELVKENAFLDRKRIFEAVRETVLSDIRRDLRRKKKNWFTVLRRRILENMLESPVFAVSSFIRFRVQDFRKYVSVRANSAVSGVREEIKYMETMAMFQSIVDRQKPKFHEIRLIVENDRFCLCNSDGEPLDRALIMSESAEGIKNEDLLLGVLIAAAPERITVQAEDEFFRTNLFSTLTNIFGSRIAVEYARSDNKSFFLKEKERK